MYKKIVKNNRGIALLVTLTVVTVLVAVSLELNRRVRSSAYSTAATRDRIALSHMASSGINAAMAMLAKDKKESDSDSLQEDWADPEKRSEVIRDIPFENGDVTLIISDELGKIQVNALVIFPEGQAPNHSQMFMWDRFLRFLISQDQTLEEIDPRMIINSVKDWLDSGDDDAITGLSGAESDYYQDLDPPYFCGNGPFTCLGELVFVRGITPDFFHGAGGIPGIFRYVTVDGINNSGEYEGRININTADLPVLAAMLPSENQDLASAIDEYRREVSDSKYIHDLSSPVWYKNVPGCSDITIDPKLITISSDLFRIESIARLNQMQVIVIAVVHRVKDKKTGKWKCRILSWQSD